jgi:hypothetical protein
MVTEFMIHQILQLKLEPYVNKFKRQTRFPQWLIELVINQLKLLLQT